jgi:hypothetical protein
VAAVGFVITTRVVGCLINTDDLDTWIFPALSGFALHPAACPGVVPQMPLVELSDTLMLGSVEQHPPSDEGPPARGTMILEVRAGVGRVIAYHQIAQALLPGMATVQPWCRTRNVRRVTPAITLDWISVS